MELLLYLPVTLLPETYSLVSSPLNRDEPLINRNLLGLSCRLCDLG